MMTYAHPEVLVSTDWVKQNLGTPGLQLFKMYGHKDVRLMDGGRVKWLNEPDKPMTAAKRFPVAGPRMGRRASLPVKAWPTITPACRVQSGCNDAVLARHGAAGRTNWAA